MKRFLCLLALALVSSLVLAACGDVDRTQGSVNAVPPVLVEGRLPKFSEPVTLKVLTHDSFAVSQSVLDAFESETNISVELLPSGDAITMTNAALLTAGTPVADVIVGFDENLLGAVIEGNLLIPYRAERLANVEPSFIIDATGVATPIDHGDVCVNFDRQYFEDAGSQIPNSFSDLLSDELKGTMVVEDPSQSTPGLAFMLSTIARFGGGDDHSDGAAWLEYWKGLKRNGVTVVDSWETAYYGKFSGGSGNGDRPLVVSYASSPPAEVADTSLTVDQTPTGVMAETCYRQTEFAGILRGTNNARAAGAFLEFMLGPSFQADVPGQMYVYPVARNTPLPETFSKYTAPVSTPLSLPFADVTKNRDRWIAQWSSIFR